MGSTVGLTYRSGQIVATNASQDVVCNIVPQRVQISNRTTAAMAQWNDNMADAAAELTIAAGTRSNEAANGITPLAATATAGAGFTLGALAHINDTTTEVLVWEAWGQ